jgi:hypothetical protein
MEARQTRFRVTLPREGRISRTLKAACRGVLLAGLSTCAAPAPQYCAAGTGTPVLLVDLFFGEAIPGRGDLTDGEWRQFLNDTVTANLPDGYTVMDANGAWMNPRTHATAREATKLLLVAVSDTPASLAAVARVRGAYQIRFQQQLVGMTVEHACGSF